MQNGKSMNIFETYDHEKIKSAIEPDNVEKLTHLHIFNTIDSTNSFLLNCSKEGSPSGVVCLAEEQTQGRGRRGRKWHASQGRNICCSLLWRFTDLENISGLSIAVAVMVANVLKKYGIYQGIQLKWPNDVLFSGRKLAGILLERNDQTGVVIGIGLNLYLSSADSNWISIHDITGQDVKRNYLTGLLLNELLMQLPVYQAQGLKTFMKVWHQHDVLFNQAVTMITPETNVSGIMQGLNEQGELLLRNDKGDLQQFCYGEVSCRLEI